MTTSKPKGTDDTVWQTQELTKTFLEGVRGAIPLAQEQVDIMLRIIDAANTDVARFLDLGCGDGVLGRAVYEAHPESQGVFVDFSEPMLTAARSRLEAFDNARIFKVDYGNPGWLAHVTAFAPFDVIVSGYSIHHQPDGRKQTLYAELYDLLAPGGLFLNIEHVSSPTPWVAQLFNDYFIDSLFAYHRRSGSKQSREGIARTFYARPDKVVNMLAPVETQCNWLRRIGFAHVDCYFKTFELAIFGGVKALETTSE